MAKFSKMVAVGYLMNTNNFTLTGRFSDADVLLASDEYEAFEIDTTEKIYSYESM
ncbi:MAG TPA: hypothetical protein VJ499_10015 [Flavisolibacter sp.]|nr:hypothetical protein [Flavisolibacter sp.]